MLPREPLAPIPSGESYAIRKIGAFLNQGKKALRFLQVAPGVFPCNAKCLHV